MPMLYALIRTSLTFLLRNTCFLYRPDLIARMFVSSDRSHFFRKSTNGISSSFTSDCITVLIFCKLFWLFFTISFGVSLSRGSKIIAWRIKGIGNPKRHIFFPIYWHVLVCLCVWSAINLFSSYSSLEEHEMFLSIKFITSFSKLEPQAGASFTQNTQCK